MIRTRSQAAVGLARRPRTERKRQRHAAENKPEAAHVTCQRPTAEWTDNSNSHSLNGSEKNAEICFVASVAPRPKAEDVVRDYAPRIYGLARLMLGNDADAEDVTQDVMLQVVRKLDTFRGDSTLATWLHRVTVNAALGLRRKRAYLKERQLAAEFDPPAGHRAPGRPPRHFTLPPEEQVLTHETRCLIERAIGRLPAMYRDVFILADVEGLPNAEVGELLGQSLAAVKSRLHRARLALRDGLAHYFAAAPA
jgi:RNA polymerase sigma-70 factor (ECF subfamily)